MINNNLTSTSTTTSTTTNITESTNINGAEKVQHCVSKKRKIEHSELVSLVSLGSVKKVKQKLLEGWDPNVKNQDMVTPVHIAANRNDLEMLQLLLNEGAKLDVVDLFGFTPLMYARINNNEKMIQLIVKTIAEHSNSNK
jgi:ankyrin repeat protein